jgi:hypothetical protein
MSVTAFAAIEHITAITAIQLVVATAPQQGVIPPGPIQQVLSLRSLQTVISGTTHQLLGGGGAKQQIVASSANNLKAIVELEIEPTRGITKGGIHIAVFVQKVVALNGKTNGIDAICNRIDQVAAHGLHIAAIVLDQVKTGFHPAFIITMEDEKIVVAVGLDPLTELAQITAADPTIQIHPGGLHSREDKPAEGIRGVQAASDLSGRGIRGQARVPAGGVDNAIQTRARGGRITELVIEPGGHL